MKYYYNELGKELSEVEKYFEISSEAIKEMYNQVGAPIFDENGLIKKGLIVRHLVLPNHIRNSKMVLKWLNNNIDKNILISVMAQYFPTNKAMATEDINRKLTIEELNEIKEFVSELGINGYIQDLENNEEQYVPKF